MGWVVGVCHCHPTPPHQAVVAHVAAKYPRAPKALLGLSVGANLVVHYQVGVSFVVFCFGGGGGEGEGEGYARTTTHRVRDHRTAPGRLHHLPACRGKRGSMCVCAAGDARAPSPPSPPGPPGG